MNSNRAPKDAEAYAAWLNRRIGAEVRRRREEQGLSAYALGKAGQVTDQTILNLEQDRVDPMLSLSSSNSVWACPCGRNSVSTDRRGPWMAAPSGPQSCGDKCVPKASLGTMKRVAGGQNCGFPE